MVVGFFGKVYCNFACARSRVTHKLQESFDNARENLEDQRVVKSLVAVVLHQVVLTDMIDTDMSFNARVKIHSTAPKSY